MDILKNLPEPLHIPRENLIKALEKKVDEEKDKRKEEQDRLDAARKTVIDQIKEFSPDELFVIFRDYFTVDADDLKKMRESKQFVPSEVKESRLETDLERAVRVLNLADDEKVEVPASSDLYHLL